MPNAIDVYIGLRLSKRRSELAIDATELASALELSRTDYDAIEAGTGQIDIRRLVVASTLLGTPIAEFFEGLGPAIASKMAVGHDPESGAACVT